MRAGLLRGDTMGLEAELFPIFEDTDPAVFLHELQVGPKAAIVTTNSNGSIDPEVLGRIDVLVEFPVPEAAAREAMWAKLLAKLKLAQAGDIDVRVLARAHELTGAEILRCVRLASSIAATEERSLDFALLQATAKERAAMRAP